MLGMVCAQDHLEWCFAIDFIGNGCAGHEIDGFAINPALTRGYRRRMRGAGNLNSVSPRQMSARNCQSGGCRIFGFTRLNCRTMITDQAVSTSNQAMTSTDAP